MRVAGPSVCQELHRLQDAVAEHHGKVATDAQLPLTQLLYDYMKAEVSGPELR
jgi:hypothetical protein